MRETATLTDNRTGKSYEFPILKGTMGPDVIDISTFFSDTGMFTFVCSSIYRLPWDLYLRFSRASRKISA